MSKFFPQLDEEFLSAEPPKQQKSNEDLDDLLKLQLQKAVNATVTDSQGQVSYDWQDPSTKVTYTIREKAVAPPVGDFRVSPDEAQNRFKLMMGEPLAKTSAKREEILNAEPSLEDSDIFQNLKQNREERLEGLKRAKIENSFQAHREKMPEELLSADERAIRDKPDLLPTRYGDIEKQHPIQKVHTDNKRGLADAPKRKLMQVAELQNMQTREHMPLRETSLLKANPVHNAQVSAFRALVLPSAKTEASQTEIQRREETEAIVRYAMDHGLVGPTVASESEQPRKADVLAYNLGRRALEGFLAKSHCPELTELPLAQRDLVTLALGRTIVHLTEESLGLGAPEFIATSTKVDSSLQRTGHGPMQGPSKDKLASEIHVSQRALAHNAQAHGKSQGHGAEGLFKPVQSELRETSQRTNEVLIENSRKVESQNKPKTQAELQEAMRRKETLLKKMLVQGCNPDLVREIIRPEVLRLSNKVENAEASHKAPMIEGLSAPVETIVQKSRKSDTVINRTIRPSQDLVMRH